MTTAPEIAPSEPTSATEWSLSPSRALDFKTCGLLYRLRVIDKLPEPPSLDAARGTVVHGILERLFDLPAPARTVAAAADLVEPQWREGVEADEELAALVDADPAGLGGLLEAARARLTSHLTLEGPRRLR